MGFIFTNLRYSMARKISGVCAKAASAYENADADDEGGFEETEEADGSAEHGNIDAVTVRTYIRCRCAVDTLRNFIHIHRRVSS